MKKENWEEQFDKGWARNNPDHPRIAKCEAVKHFIRLLLQQEREEKKRWLEFYRKDIKSCFKPICTNCNRLATEQTARGKTAQRELHRPVNWGYYCKKCADEGREIEREAMFGN